MLRDEGLKGCTERVRLQIGVGVGGWGVSGGRWGVNRQIIVFHKNHAKPRDL